MSQDDRESRGLSNDSRATSGFSRRAVIRGGMGAAALGALAVRGADASEVARQRKAFIPRAAQSSSPPDFVDVYPLPSTRTASPRTEITFRGAGQEELGNVRVTGSESGVHTGIFAPHSD